MVVLGALANGLEACAGGLLGLALKGRVSQDLGDFLLKGQGLAVVLVAVQGMAAGGSVTIATLALALGAAVGHLLDIDAAIRRLGDWAERRLSSAFADSRRLGGFSEGFTAATLFTCTGAMAIVGALDAGLAGDPSTLVAKGVIDLVVCIPMAATLGIGVPFCGVPLFVYEAVLSLAASGVGPLLTEAVITEVATVGSLLLFAIGTNLLGVTQLKVANLLPATLFPVLLVPAADALAALL